MVTTREWSDELLDGLRVVGDPPADDVVAAFHAERPEIGPRDLTAAIVEHLRLPDDLRSPTITAYLADRPPLPGWAERERIDRGQEFFGAYGTHVATALFHASLPWAYAAANGVQVLALTARLVSDPQRRVVETAQMLLDVMTPGALEPGRDGYFAARGVRLMHASVRHMILHDPDIERTCDESVPRRWCDEWGHPVNQEDLLGTLLTFTWVVFEALDTLGVDYRLTEADDYLHAWNVVGHLLGIREDLLPLTLHDAADLATKIRERQHAPSTAGREHTEALVEMLQRSAPWGLLGRGFPAALIRHLLGNETADLLGVRSTGLVSLALALAGRLGSLVPVEPQHLPLVRWVSDQLSRALLHAFIRIGRGEHRPAFAVPPSLVGPLGLPTG